MKGFFNFHKSEKPSFDKKKECLEQIKFPDTANELVSISDEIQSGYDDPRWINKSNSI